MTTLDLNIFVSEFEELSRLYWQLDESGEFTHKVAELADTFGLKHASITKIVKESCTAYSTTFHCSVCERPVEFSTRSDYQTYLPNPNWECGFCVEVRQMSIDDRKRELVEDAVKRARSNPINTEKMNFREAAYLLALVRYSADEDLSQLQALESNQSDLLTPDSDFDLQMVKDLYRAEVIAISPLSPLEAIELNEEGGFSFYLNRVIWEVPLSEEDTLPRVVSRLEKKFSEMEYLDTEYEEISSLCSELCLLECLAYLNYVVEDHKLSFRVGEKTKMVLSSTLEKFSVAQVYNFIWRAGKDAAAFYLRSGVPRTHAANTIVGNIQKQVERALANGWEIKPFRRNFNMPQSILSQVVFNLALETDDGGFHRQIQKVI